MKLTYFQGSPPNFGDELNTYLWPKLLPADFLDADETRLFLGIGSILWDHLPKQPHKYIVGSGYGGYAPPPDVHDGSWTPIFVRGPRTAAALGLPAELAICDAAILLRAVEPAATGARRGIGFMPHFQSLARGQWAAACRLAGIDYVDPTAPVETTLAQISGLDLLITEAMHGAIVADALRTPWIAARPIHSEHHAKWLDWAEALGLELRWAPLRPSSLEEAYVSFSKGRAYYEGRIVRAGRHQLARPLNGALAHLAAERLRQIAKREPQLSADANIERATARASAAVVGLLRTAA